MNEISQMDHIAYIKKKFLRINFMNEFCWTDTLSQDLVYRQI
jgi:hypothetical protein